MACEYDTYIDTVEEIENRIEDDDKYPVVKDAKIKKCCHMTLEFIKFALNYVRFSIVNGTEKKKEH